MKNFFNNTKRYVVMVAAPVAVFTIIVGSIKLVCKEEN